MRFLITPNYALPYDQRMVQGLAAGLREVGQEAHALDGPIDPRAAAVACRTHGADVLLQVNRFRPTEPPLPPGVRHVAWFQDIFPETVGDDVVSGTRPTDIVYALGDPAVLGLNVPLPCYVGSLVTGVDDRSLRAAAEPVSGAVDLSLCGFIPPPVVLARNLRLDMLVALDALQARLPFVGRMNAFWLGRRLLFRRQVPSDYVPYTVLVSFKNIVEKLYHPLRGDLDIHALSAAMRRAAKLPERHSPALAAMPGAHRGRAHRYFHLLMGVAPDRTTAVERAISYFARDYPRLLDRAALVNGVMSVSKSLELYGPGWERHEAFRPYWRGVIESPGELLLVYRKSRINLANNTHGIGLHSRTLECMAVGGFIFTHASPHDDKPGGMLTCFEPGVHYGMYTPDTLQEETRRWLRDETRRVSAGARAAEVVRAKHLWRHRAEQILQDLGR